MFTVEQRDALYEHVLHVATDDERVVAGALVGSLAVDEADQYSDLDLTFGISGADVADVLDDWTHAFRDELSAVPLVDLDHGPTTYRVFLLPHLLQLDLSMTPGAAFRPAGPRFKLLFGETAPNEPEAGSTGPGDIFIATPSVPGDIFGWGVIYATHAYRCVERGRVWQAEHYIGAVRDHALTLACLRLGMPAAQARGFDELPPEVLAGFGETHIADLQPHNLRSALDACVSALSHEGEEAHLPDFDAIAGRIKELRAVNEG